jgi:arginine N-succinyltransferase
MMCIRPIATEDLPALLKLAAKTGIGLTTLPNNEKLLQARIAASVASFAGHADPAEQIYMFVLEDLALSKIVGTCAVAAAVGLREPWYSYRVGQVVHASKELGIFTQTPTLFLSNDHTGHSELCSLFLDPEYRVGKNGALLSKCRFLFIAQFRALFSQKIIAELRGVSDENGASPFWESLGRHFFSMEFSQADYLTGIGQKSFVAELMPKHPLYSSFLTPEAQAVIGKTHEATLPARSMLESEGFRYEGHVDIFDAGPTVECNVDDVRAVSQSIMVTVSQAEHTDASQTNAEITPTRLIVANTQKIDFRAAVAVSAFPLSQIKKQAVISLNAETFKALNLIPGDQARVVALSARG